MIIDFEKEKVHLYIIAWLQAMLAEHDDNPDFVEGALRDYFDVQMFVPLSNWRDFAYLLETKNCIYLSVSGTKNAAAWVDDCRIFFPVRGFHNGFRASFNDLIAKPLVQFIGNSKKPVVTNGHSRGEVVSKYGAFYLRDELKLPDVQHVGFCGPLLTNKKGFNRCKDAKLRSTRIWVDKGDLVDDVGVLAGKHYGYSVELPYCGKPDVLSGDVVDRVLGGHAPSYVTKCMKQLFINWKKPEQLQYLDAIAQFAEK
jgi:hypothetical protein